ncbi:MAG: hypothetical protein RLZZ177_2488 [Pseudomonadota bacterium]
MRSTSFLSVATFLALGMGGLHAQAVHSDSSEDQRWSLHLGSGYHQKRIGINLESAPLWTSSFMGKAIELSSEVGIAHWTYHGPRVENQTRALVQLSAIPVFRWWVGKDLFLEGGIGATLVSKNELGPRQLSTSFQFGDHIGFGYRLNPNNWLGLRYSHYSNASIKKPNNGLDTLQMTWRTAY